MEPLTTHLVVVTLRLGGLAAGQTPRLGEGARQCYFVGIPNCRAPETALAASGLERLLSDGHSALGRRFGG
jgi:hypothetical protein